MDKQTKNEPVDQNLAMQTGSNQQQQIQQPQYQRMSYSISQQANNQAQQFQQYNNQPSNYGAPQQNQPPQAIFAPADQQNLPPPLLQAHAQNQPLQNHSVEEHQRVHNNELTIKFDKIRSKIEDQASELNAFKAQELPLARIKKIMKSDEDVRMISSEAPILFALACQMFITELTHKAAFHASWDNRKTLQRSDIHRVICENETFDFLLDVIPSGSIPDKFKMSPHQNALWQDCKRMKELHSMMYVGQGANNQQQSGLQPPQQEEDEQQQQQELFQGLQNRQICQQQPMLAPQQQSNAPMMAGGMVEQQAQYNANAMNPEAQQQQQQQQQLQQQDQNQIMGGAQKSSQMQMMFNQARNQQTNNNVNRNVVKSGTTVNNQTGPVEQRMGNLNDYNEEMDESCDEDDDDEN